MNIYQKMDEITARLGVVAKNLNINAGKSFYKAVGEADILEAVKPLEHEVGIYSYPVSRQIVDRDTLCRKSTYSNGGTQEKTELFMRVETTYRFANVDNPEEYIDIISYGDGIDTGDKAPGKAMTYSDKYALMKAYKITTGDDPDQTASPQEPFEAKKIHPVCSLCGAAIVGGKLASGRELTGEQFADETRMTFGKPLCRKCAAEKAAKNAG